MLRLCLWYQRCIMHTYHSDAVSEKRKKWKRSQTGIVVFTVTLYDEQGIQRERGREISFLSFIPFLIFSLSVLHYLKLQLDRIFYRDSDFSSCWKNDKNDGRLLLLLQLFLQRWKITLGRRVAVLSISDSFCVARRINVLDSFFFFLIFNYDNNSDLIKPCLKEEISHVRKNGSTYLLYRYYIGR